MSLRDTLKGTGVALVTPFNEKGEVDFDAYGNLIDFVLHGGVEYLVALGTTAETPTLDKQEKIDIANFTFEKVHDSIPVVVGVGGNNTKELLHDLETLPIQKAAAILSVSPYYSRPSQEGIYQHYKLIAEVAPKPLILYNVPGRTGSNIDAETVVRLAHDCENIQGIKEASGNMGQCLHIMKHRPTEFIVVSGDDNLAVPQIAAGMDGVISVAANCFPKDFSEMIRQSITGNLIVARGLLYKLLEGFDLLFAENNPAGVKAVLAELGVIKNHLRLPLVPLSTGVHERVKSFLSTI